MTKKQAATTEAKKIERKPASLTPVQLEAVRAELREIGMNDEQIARAIEKMTSKPEAKPVQPQPDASLPTLLPGDGIFDVSLSALKNLVEAEVPDGQYAMRPLKEENVDHLLISLMNGDTLPPIVVAPSNKGAIIADGNHRREAHKRLILLALKREGKISTSDEKLLSPAEQKTFQEEMKNYEVKVEERTYTSYPQLIEDAFKANLDHGLAADDRLRGQYGLWIMSVKAAQGTPISLRKAAVLAKCSHQAIMKARDRANGTAKTKKLAEAPILPEDQALVEEYEQERKQAASNVSTKDAEEKHALAVFSAARFLNNNGWATKVVGDTYATWFIDITAKVTTDDIVALSVFLHAASEVVYARAATEKTPPAEQELPGMDVHQEHQATLPTHVTHSEPTFDQSQYVTEYVQ